MSKQGHNTGPVVADRLKLFIERIEKLIEERIAIQGDIKDVFSEAKAIGYDVGTMRKVIRLRGMDAADRAEQEALLDVYLHALGMIDRVETRLSAGESTRQAAEAEGVSKSTAHRVSQKQNASPDRKNGTGKLDVISPPEVAVLSTHDPETGEITETPDLDTPAGDGAGTGDVTSAPAPAVANYSGDDMPPIPDFLRRVAA